MYVTTATVRTHIKPILAKLDTRDRTQAVVCAHRSGFMDQRA